MSPRDEVYKIMLSMHLPTTGSEWLLVCFFFFLFLTLWLQADVLSPTPSDSQKRQEYLDKQVSEAARIPRQAGAL
jgi:hypothetical protein